MTTLEEPEKKKSQFDWVGLNIDECKPVYGGLTGNTVFINTEFLPPNVMMRVGETFLLESADPDMDGCKGTVLEVDDENKTAEIQFQSRDLN